MFQGNTSLDTRKQNQGGLGTLLIAGGIFVVIACLASKLLGGRPKK